MKMYNAKAIVACMMAHPQDNPMRYKAGITRLRDGSAVYYIERRGWFSSKLSQFKGLTVSNQGGGVHNALLRDKVQINNYLLCKAMAFIAKQDSELGTFGDKIKVRVTASNDPNSYFAKRYPGQTISASIALLEGMTRAYRAGWLPAFETAGGIEEAAKLMPEEQARFRGLAKDEDAASTGSGVSIGSVGTFTALGGDVKRIFLGRFDQSILDECDALTTAEFAKQVTSAPAQAVERPQTPSTPTALANESSPQALLILLNKNLEMLASLDYFLRESNKLNPKMRKDGQDSLVAKRAEGLEIVRNYLKNIHTSFAQAHGGEATSDYIANMKQVHEQFCALNESLVAEEANKTAAALTEEGQKSLAYTKEAIRVFGGACTDVGLMLATATNRKAQFDAVNIATATVINPFYKTFSSDALTKTLIDKLADTARTKSVGPALDAIHIIATAPINDGESLVQQAASIKYFARDLLLPEDQVKKLTISQLAKYHQDTVAPALRAVNLSLHALNERLDLRIATVPLDKHRGQAVDDDAGNGLKLLSVNAGAQGILVPNGIQEDGRYLRLAKEDGDYEIESHLPDTKSRKEGMALHRLRAELVKADLLTRSIYSKRIAIYLNPTTVPRTRHDLTAYAQAYVRHIDHLYPATVPAHMLPVIKGDHHALYDAAIAKTKVTPLETDDIEVEDLTLLPHPPAGSSTEQHAAVDAQNLRRVFVTVGPDLLAIDEQARIVGYVKEYLPGWDEAKNGDEKSALKRRGQQAVAVELGRFSEAAAMAKIKLDRFLEENAAAITTGDQFAARKMALTSDVRTHEKTVALLTAISAGINGRSTKLGNFKKVEAPRLPAIEVAPPKPTRTGAAAFLPVAATPRPETKPLPAKPNVPYINNAAVLLADRDAPFDPRLSTVGPLTDRQKEAKKAAAQRHAGVPIDNPQTLLDVIRSINAPVANKTSV